MRILAACISILFMAIPALGQTITKQITVQDQDRYLNIPVAGWSGDFEGEQSMMRILHNGEVLDEFSVSLPKGDPDWWGFFPLERYRGSTLTVELDDPAGQEALNKVFADSVIANQSELYHERYRQQVHFSNKRGWNNDPNGLIYYKGAWHMFFQWNPYGWSWGNMHWGHAISNDLVHWKELPAALYSPDHDHMAFSGGALVDPQNTSGFRRDGVDPLIAAYTRTGSGEHLALSYDNGRTFEEFEENPVVKHAGRDPKIIWYEPGEHWVMVVYDESRSRKMRNGSEVIIYQHAIYTSDNLKSWTYQSGVSTMFECPELFKLPVEGSQDESKWVMYDADGKYFVGTFDGKDFHKEQGLRELDHGGAFYASQTFSNVPKADGRRIQVGWFQTTTPYMPFNQSMTFPAELKLLKEQGEYILAPTPIDEIETLHENSFIKKNVVLDDSTLSLPVYGDQLHIIAEIDRGDAPLFGIEVNGYEFTYSNLRTNLNETFYPIDDDIKLELIVDRMGMDVFVDDGRLYYAIEHNSVDQPKVMNVFARDRKILIKNLEVYKLESIWE